MGNLKSCKTMINVSKVSLIHVFKNEKIRCICGNERWDK